MIITKQVLRTDAERLLEVLRDEKISSLESALNAVERRIKIREMLPDYIHLFTRPSNAGTTALKISYESLDFEGIPLELIINPKLNYRQLIVKCNEIIAGYTAFSSDDYDNIRQFKKSQRAEWLDAIKDVEEIAKLT